MKNGQSELKAPPPNPFTDYSLDLVFTHGDQTMGVPGYFAADGGKLQQGSLGEIKGGGIRLVGNPPNNPERDWVVLVQR